jgi:transposase
MPQNFIECDREQSFLMPLSLREWLPEDDLVWRVIDAVDQVDLSAFYASYRADGHGRAAYEPSMMVALVLYAFATQQRSSRAIERHCSRDITYRVITANQAPDHATIARFICRHEAALAELFSQVLSLCAKAGLVKVGVVAIDGTKVKASASPESNRDYEQIAREILAEAKATDEAEDRLYGDARGDELPEHLRTAEGRRQALREAKVALERERQESEDTEAGAAEEPTPIIGGTSTPSGSSPACRAARAGCARQGASWSTNAGRIPSPSRARAPSDCSAQSGACSRSFQPAGWATRNTSATGRGGR